MRIHEVRWSGRVLVAAITLFASAIATSPTAFADHIYQMTLRTTDGNPGGTGRFDGRGYDEYLWACDDQADGYRAVVRVYDWAGHWHLVGREDAAQGAGTCSGKGVMYLEDGYKVNVAVCLQNGYYGTPKFCNTGYATI